MRKYKKGKGILVILLLIILFISIFFIFLLKKDNKQMNFGNTMISQTKDQMLNYILNISSYEAKVEITVTSNKNQNKYMVLQKYISPKQCIQEVQEPSNIQGLRTIYDGTNLKLENTRLNLSTVYENYPYLSENHLWLTTFIEEYKTAESSTCEEKETEWILHTKKIQDRNEKTLKIDKKTGMPTKLEVQDKNQNTIVYIVYNEIKINNLKEKDILAFQNSWWREQI